MPKEITLTQLTKLKPIIRVDSLLKKAFDDDDTDIARVRSKLWRKSPALTKEESSKIAKVLHEHGIFKIESTLKEQ